MAVTIRFKSNLDEVLDRIDSATAKALLEIGATVQGDAINNSPVRTGALRSSWTVELDEDKKTVSIGVLQGDLEGDYAKYVELGTRRQKAQHMLRNAVNENMHRFHGIVEAELHNA